MQYIWIKSIYELVCFEYLLKADEKVANDNSDTLHQPVAMQSKILLFKESFSYVL